MGFAPALLCLFFLSCSAWAKDDPDPYDNPRTELMDILITREEIQFGVDLPSFLPGIDGKFEVTGISPHFSWHGIVELGVPVKIIESLDWRTLDVAAGGYWEPGSDRSPSKDGGTVDKKAGLGIEVLSYEQGGIQRNIQEGEAPYESYPTDALVRVALRGVMASFHWTSLIQEHYGNGAVSDLLSISAGAGYGNFGMKQPEAGSIDENGTIYHARFDIQLIGGTTHASCSYTIVQGDDSSAWRGSLEIEHSLSDRLSVGGGVKYSSVKMKGVDLDFNQVPEKGIRADVLRGFLSLGLNF